MNTETIDKWIIEATSGYNDGWTQKHYRDQLQGVYDRLNDLEFILKDKNGVYKTKGKNKGKLSVKTSPPQAKKFFLKVQIMVKTKVK